MKFSDRRKYDRGESWSPNPAPVEQADLPKYLNEELSKLSKAVWKDDRSTVSVMPREPKRPREGDMVVMDDGSGTNQLKIYLNEEWQIVTVTPVTT